MKKFFINKGSITNCNLGDNTQFVCHNYAGCKSSQAEDVPEAVDFEEVVVDTNSSKSVTSESKTNMPVKDYSNSPLIPYMTYPQHANYLLSWLHANMDNQDKGVDIVRPLRAAVERGLFLKEIDYKDFVAEFGECLSESWYSRLMSSSYYNNEELSTAIMTLDVKLFN